MSSLSTAARSRHAPKQTQTPRQSSGGGIPAKRPRKPRRATEAAASNHSALIGERATSIKGRFRSISVHQLTLAWWLHVEGHITRRQLRVWFAAHEMAERRRYAKHTDQQLFTLEELKHLVGGRGSASADAELRADLALLGRIGLVSMSGQHLEIAKSADQITLQNTKKSPRKAAVGGLGDGDGLLEGAPDVPAQQPVGNPAKELAGFWQMFDAIPNRQRRLPVPRRLLRALAGGFSRGVTAYIIAMLIRGLFWHRETQDYRTDGRVKLAWVAEHFKVSRRAVTAARNTLIELGWIKPLDVTQWQMNKWGVRDQINPDWDIDRPDAQLAQTANTPETTAKPASTSEATSPSESAAVGGVVNDAPKNACDARKLPGGSASPGAGFSGGIASPESNRSLHFVNQNTRNLVAEPRRRRSGVSTNGNRDQGAGQGGDKLHGQSPAPTERVRQGKPGPSASPINQHRQQSRGGSQRKTGQSARLDRRPTQPEQPNIRDIQAADLKDTDRLLELYRQASQIGLISASEAGRLDFLAMAERARARASKPGAMLYWLLRERKTQFITQADEEAAAARLRRHLNGPRGKSDEQLRRFSNTHAGTNAGSSGGAWEVKPAHWTDTLTDDERFVLACIKVGREHKLPPHRVAATKGWTKPQWDEVYASYQQKEQQRWLPMRSCN